MKKMSKTNLGMLILITIAVIILFLFASSFKNIFTNINFEILSIHDYGFNHKLPSDWEIYSVKSNQNNDTKPTHELMKTLDANYKTMIIRHSDWDSSYQDLTFVLYKIKSWNKNASTVTNSDNSKLPPIVYHSSQYVFSVDPYDYDMNRKKYDEVINILYDLTYIEHDQGDFKVHEAVTIESDSIVYKEDTNVIDVTWRTVLYDSIQTTGDYSLEKEENGLWVSVFSSHNDSLMTLIEDSKSMYPVEKLTTGHYRLSVEYERLSLYGLELNDRSMYKTFAEFDVGSETIKRNDEALKGIGLETEYKVYPKDSLEIRCKWFNMLNDEFMYGNYFTLEKFENDSWQTVDLGDRGFDSIGYSLSPQSEAWHTYNIGGSFESLDKGNYRIKSDIIRETLEGVDFGSGNYPNYVFYSPFEIGDVIVRREMTEISSDAFFYNNDMYGFGIRLSDDWMGLKLIEENQNSRNSNHKLYHELDPNYKIIRLSHPKQFLEDVDIILILFNRDSWNDNAIKASNSDLDILPEIYFSNDDFVFSSDAFLYNFQLDHYNKILKMIKTMKNY